MEESEVKPVAVAEEGERKIVLRTEGLVKKYGARTVVNHVSIDVTQGEIVGLLGPNGASLKPQTPAFSQSILPPWLLLP